VVVLLEVDAVLFVVDVVLLVEVLPAVVDFFSATLIVNLPIVT
jgi:hypothetical protein